MNYEELKTIAKDMKDVKNRGDSELITFASLVKLPPQFYAEMGAYIREMEAELNSTSPSAPDYRILEKELNESKKLMEKIFLNRRGKIMELAILSASNSKVNTSTMVNEEYE